MYQEHFNCGSIRPDRSDKTLKYEVRSVRDLEKFALVCKKMSRGGHLTEQGFQEIIELVFTINTGKRKYAKEVVKI